MSPLPRRDGVNARLKDRHRLGGVLAGEAVMDGEHHPRLADGQGDGNRNGGIGDGVDKLRAVDADRVQAEGGEIADVVHHSTVGVVPDGKALEHDKALLSVFSASIVPYYGAKCKFFSQNP